MFGKSRLFDDNGKEIIKDDDAPNSYLRKVDINFTVKNMLFSQYKSAVSGPFSTKSRVFDDDGNEITNQPNDGYKNSYMR